MRWTTVTLLSLLASALAVSFAGRGARAERSSVGSVDGGVVIRGADDRTEPGAGVVVYLESDPRLDELGQPVVRRVGQKNRLFTPLLTVIPKGSSIEFPNDDRVFHNVFSLSSAKRFDLGLFRDGESRSVTFQRAGVVDVYCNIHPQMQARIHVVPNSFYAVTDADGRFRIADVPAGSYTVVAWNGGETRATVEIKPGSATSLSIELAPAPQKKRHLRKDGTPYRRY